MIEACQPVLPTVQSNLRIPFYSYPRLNQRQHLAPMIGS
jgi:hypothetical protein